MPIPPAEHTAFLYDRGGVRPLGILEPITHLKWERIRDATSGATIEVATPGINTLSAIGLCEAGRTEVVIYRGAERVWEGPIHLITYTGDSVTIECRDITQYMATTIMRNEYDSSYPHVEDVLDRIKRILNTEMARKEGLYPPANFLPYVDYIYNTGTAIDARTAAKTLPYESTVFDHIDSLAANGGLDYTAVGRKTLFFDVHQQIGRTPMVTATDFLGDPVITQYASGLATYVAMTDGMGHWGDAGGTDAYYGEVEALFQAFNQTTSKPGAQPPTSAEMAAQASRNLAQSKVPPYDVRIPANTALNPQGVLSISDLVPGVWIPLSANLPGRSLSQMQKLDSMTCEVTADAGEVFSVVMSSAPMGT